MARERIALRHYGRNWALYIDGKLLAVVTYKRGALAIIEALVGGAA